MMLPLDMVLLQAISMPVAKACASRGRRGGWMFLFFIAGYTIRGLIYAFGH